MSEKPDDGGSAFPYAAASDSSGNQRAGTYGDDPGMTLRDWFAGQAIIGVIASQTRMSNTDISIEAYDLADAMIATRKVKIHSPAASAD